MKLTIHQLVVSLFLFGFLCFGATQSEENQTEGDWIASEYSGSRSEKDLRTAMASKGFAWLSGSPADNEKLSIGKNAQFFGFVSLRSESGRAANRGALGRAFFSILSKEQQSFLYDAVIAEEEALANWWDSREAILSLFEEYLYIGEAIDKEKATALGVEFSKLNANVAIHEARAFAALEDCLDNEQLDLLKLWRYDPEQAYELDMENRLPVEGLERDQLKQLEDLYAKAFSWITGTAEDNEIIPLGQPAQFFGFVSIRHKSGKAANRGDIAKAFLSILEPNQLAFIDSAVEEQMPVVQSFLEQRHLFLEHLALLRSKEDAFDFEIAIQLASAMGKLEVEAGWIEANAYRHIRETMSNEQVTEMIALRGDYVLDESEVDILSVDERGAQLDILCSGCHGAAGENRSGLIGPTLDGMFDRPIASLETYDYSKALQEQSLSSPWTSGLLDQFLASPKTFVPGTKMEFQGLLNIEDRSALIDYLLSTR